MILDVIISSLGASKFQTTGPRERKFDKNLNGKFVIQNFTISRVPSENFFFFRLRQTGKNHYGIDCFIIASLESYGRR